MRIVINVDDFGMNAAVNRAVAELHACGSISSATLLVDRPGSAEAAALALAAGIPVGLHFNLTIESLCRGRREFERRYLSGRLPMEAVERELRRQLAALRALGLTPTHIDSHQHVHRWPRLFRVVAGVAADAGLPVRLVAEWPVRARGAARGPRDGVHLLFKWAWRRLADCNRRTAGRLGVATCARLVSTAYLVPRPARLTAEHLADVLAAAVPGSELMCHAAVPAAAHPGHSPHGSHTVQGYHLMRAPAFAAGVAAAGLQPVSYRELVAATLR